MSLDRSLKTKGGLIRRRNVLKRSERLAQLEEEERWEESDSVFGLPKVAVKRVKTSKAKAAVAEGQAGGAAEQGQADSAGAAKPSKEGPASK